MKRLPMRRAFSMALLCAGLASTLFCLFYPPAMRDFEANYAAGILARLNTSPYAPQALADVESATVWFVSATRGELLPFIDPPWVATVMRPLSFFPFRQASGFMAAGEVISAFAIVALLPYILEPSLPTAIAASLAAVAFVPIYGAIGLGSLSLPTTAGVLGSLYLVKQRKLRNEQCDGTANAKRTKVIGAHGRIRYRASNVLISSALVLTLCLASLQPSLGIACATFALSRVGFRFFLSSAAAALTLLLALSQSPAMLLSYFQLLPLHNAAEFGSVIQVSPGSILRGIGASTRVAQIAAELLAVSALAVGVRVFLIEQRRKPAEAVNRKDVVYWTATACALLPLVLGFFHPKDFAIEVLPALLLSISVVGRRAFLAGFCSTLLSVDWFDIGAQPRLPALAFCVACIFAVAYAAAVGSSSTRALSPSSRVTFRIFGVAFSIDRPACIGGLCAALLILPAMVMMQNHPIPIWPDAMRSAEPVTTLADTWHRELAAAGLFAHEPRFGILRIPYLVGSLLLYGLLLTQRSSCKQREGRSTAPTLDALKTLHSEIAI